MTLDPRIYVTERLPKTEAKYAFEEYSNSAPQVWQRKLAVVLGQTIGGLRGLRFWERPSLDPQVSETVVLDGYRRERVEFTTRPGLQAMGYYLAPDGIAAGERRPAVLCLPGHGAGVNSIVGIGSNGEQRKRGEPDGYQADFALQCVTQGYPTFALEQISFGHRRDTKARQTGPEASSCTRDAMAALMLGETIIGWRVWDAMRALEFMEAQPEVDPAQLATMGISGGGLTSLFTAALDTRVAACVVSGYLNTFDSSVLAIDHCPDNYAPGLREWCEMPDIAGLVAPRLLFAESGTEDHIFPLAAFKTAAAQVARIYEVFDAPSNFAYEIFEGGHRFHGTGAFQFLTSVFKAKGS